VRDKLFFFGFIRWDDTEYMHNVGYRNTVTQNEAPYYGAKVDWNITPNHRIEGTYLVDDTDLGSILYTYDRDTRTQGDFVGTGTQARGGDNWIGKYTGIFTENFLFSAQYGYNAFDRTDSSSNDPCYYAIDVRSGTSQRVGCWVNWQIASGGDEREAYRIDADWYLGNHSLRGGADYESNSSTENAVYSGGSRFVYYMNGTRFPQYGADVELIQNRIRSTGGTFDVKSNAVYAQDSWSITPELTFNFGVRWESYENMKRGG